MSKPTHKSNDSRPAWWVVAQNSAGYEDPQNSFKREEDWDAASAPKQSHLLVVVEVTERRHDGYCSGLDTDEDGRVTHWSGEELDVEETTYRMVGAIPLKDEHGQNWNFQGPPFDPLWLLCNGSGVCNLRPSVQFLSMTRVNKS